MNVEGIKTYLRDVELLETHIFTLEQVAKQFETETTHTVDKEIEALSEELALCEQEIDKFKDKIYHAKKSKEATIEKHREAFAKEIKTDWVVIIFLALFTCGLAVIGYMIYETIHDKKARKKWEIKCEEDNAYWNKIIENYERTLDQHIQKAQLLNAQINQLKERRGESSRQDFYKQQIQAIERHLQTLTETRAKLYAFDIVPEEYRALDCLLYLHQVFKIELADNMKDAIRIYEQKIFSGDVIKGIQHIYARLDELSGHMPFITATLDNVSCQVKEMCQEIYECLQNGETHPLGETKINRYATQALQESNERLAWYEEQRRLGLL